MKPTSGRVTLLPSCKPRPASCNLHKASNLSGIDPLTDSIARLFDPRNDEWSDHFSFHGTRIVGRTAVGRATVRVMGMNDRERVELRIHLLEAEGF